MYESSRWQALRSRLSSLGSRYFQWTRKPAPNQQHVAWGYPLPMHVDTLLSWGGIRVRTIGLIPKRRELVTFRTKCVSAMKPACTQHLAGE